MNHRNTTLVLCMFILLIPFAVMMGCSRGSSTIIPDDPTYDSLPAISDAGQTGTGSDRQLQGMWETSFNLEDVGNLVGKTVPIEPIRTADLHLNVRPFIATPWIYVRSWNPTTETLDLDVTIRNTSVYNGYDLRLIIFRDTIGHKLLNPDNYTHLWDIPEGTYSNGFIAYAKDNDHRILHSGELRWERVQILCPGGNFSIKFAIDASWPSNCEEPYMMNNFTQGMLQAYQGATSDITVDVYDWQDNVDSVRIQCSTITGETDTYMTKISGTKWGVELVNNNAVPEGDYFALIAAISSGSTDPLIHTVNVTVSPEVGNGYALTWGGSGDDHGYGIAVDTNGNVFVTGDFMTTVDFNPDPVEEDIHIAANGYQSGFLTKFDSHGDFQWARTFGADGSYTVAKAVGIGIDESIFVCGESRSYVVGMFLMKYDQDGNLLWQGSWCDGYTDDAGSIKVRYDGSVVVAGYFTGSGDFDPGPGVDNHTASSWDAFVNVFDSSCNQLWSAVWGSGGYDDVIGSDVDTNGNVLCAGRFEGTVDFNPGTGTDNHSSNGYDDAFLIKLTSSGSYAWAKTWGGPYTDAAGDCAVDEFDDIYVVGSFYYTVDFDPDPIGVEERTAVWYDDGFVSKFNSSGDFEWVFTLGTEGYEENRLVTTDQAGHFYLGAYTANTDFDPGPSEFIAGGHCIANYNLDMTFNWVSSWGSLEWQGMTTDIQNNCYMTGYFNSQQDFDPGPDKYRISPYGSWDTFFFKILPNGLWE
jgi:hypothetical protein